MSLHCIFSIENLVNTFGDLNSIKNYVNISHFNVKTIMLSILKICTKRYTHMYVNFIPSDYHPFLFKNVML